MNQPRRFRQSLLARADVCRHSAMLALKYPDQEAHQLAFGSAFHAFAERLVSDLIAHGEKSLYAPAEGEDPVAAAREVASMSAAILDEVMAEGKWPVPIAHPSHSVDHLRQCCYHLAAGLDIDPANVLGLEQEFELQLGCGRKLSGRVDVLQQLRPDVLGVEDYKTSFNVPSQSDYEALFQMFCYPLLVMFGYPVERVNCSRCEGRGGIDPSYACCRDALCEEHLYHGPCEDCEGRGYVNRPLPALGDGIQYVRSRQIFPRYLDDDGTVRVRDVLFSRQQLQDWRHDLERLAADLTERLDGNGPWPATPGSHCSECACPADCPLPAELRKHAGTVNTVDDAREALASVLTARDGADALMKEIKAWAKNGGRVVVGDIEYDWRDVTRHDPVPWDRLEAALFEAVNFGVPFEKERYIRTRTSPSFSKRKLVPEEIAAQVDEEANANGSAAERFGDDAPF